MQAASRIPEDRASIHTGPGRNSTWQRRLTLLAMCIAQGMILLDITIVNVALPSIQRELHESSGELEWVISAYALSLAALIPLSGSLMAGGKFASKQKSPTASLRSPCSSGRLLSRKCLERI